MKQHGLTIFKKTRREDIGSIMELHVDRDYGKDDKCPQYFGTEV
jgi:hypothetical protein